MWNNVFLPKVPVHLERARECVQQHPNSKKGLGSIDAVFGLIFKMAEVTRFDSTRFVNYKNGVFNSLHGWLPWQRAYFEDYCCEAIRHVSLRS